MREISAAAITECVARLCVRANRALPPDAERALRAAAEAEPWPLAKGILSDLAANLDTARETGLPICQDTGLVTVFAELGQDVHISGGTLNPPYRRACAAATGRAASGRALWPTRSGA